MLHVGFVGIQPREAPVYTNFLKRMAELGYQEGRNFTFDYIQTPDVEGYERNYRELAARKVDVFLAVGTERALRAALLAAEGKPIVLLAIDFDPVTRGYKPSDMPIEQSPRFYMAVNLKTAASLGITLPDVFVARANEVRE
jgi:putative tryptophan/tyrosine transport system substrate-binding protein